MRRPFFLLLLLSLFSLPLHAETTIQLGANSVSITLLGVDDHINCKLNGKVVASQNFGDPIIKRDITSKLVKGVNRLTCRATDDNGGSCFEYNYQVWYGRNGQPASLAHSSAASCCQSECARPGNPVLNETLWINKP